MSLSIVVDMNLSVEWVPLLTQAGWVSVPWVNVGDPHADVATIGLGQGERARRLHP